MMENPPITSLTIEGEAQWLRLKRQIEWTEGFSLILLFSDQPQVVDVFRRRLADIYKLRVTRLRTPRFERPEQLLTQALPLLLEKLPTPAIVNAPIWLDLTSSTGQDKEWEEARRRFYQRLNENREVLRTRLRPVVIILPAKERFVFRELAPDLWAIRDITLATSAWIPRDDSPVVEKQAPSTDSPKPFSFRQQKAIDEWERVRQRQRGRDVLIVGDRAFKAAYKARQLEVARKISGEMEALARKLVEQVGETPESLRDLSISLNNTASIAKAQGDLEAATRQYGEAVGIYRSLLERFPAMSGLRAELDNVESQYRSVAPR